MEVDQGKRWLSKLKEKIEFLLTLEDDIDELLDVITNKKQVVVEETPTPNNNDNVPKTDVIRSVNNYVASQRK